MSGWLLTEQAGKGVSAVPLVDPSWWTSGELTGRPMRDVLRDQDVRALFRFLRRKGFTDTAIGNKVEMTHHRVGGIISEGIKNPAYNTLMRVASGLDIPLWMMGLGSDNPSGPVPFAKTEFGSRRRAPNDGASYASDPLCDLARTRAELDEALASTSVSPQQTGLIEEATADLMCDYPSMPAVEMLPRLASECSQVTTLSKRRQPASIQRRLSSTAALLATMLADAMMRLGDATEARHWYETALVAAHDSLEPRLGVLVRAQAAMLPYYFGNPRQTVALADAALAIDTAPTPLTVLASAGRARALAQLGRAGEARAAIVQSRELFATAGEDDSDSAFRFPEKRLLFYLSGAHTWLGDTAEAYRLQENALRLYGPTPAVPLDPALINLDRATCLVKDRRRAEAASTAREAIASLPAAQRTEIVLRRAEQVFAAVPSTERSSAVFDLLDFVHACRDDARTLVDGRIMLDPLEH